MKKRAGASSIALAALVLVSCQQFFTTSVAAPLARDSASLVPDVTAGNAAELAETMKGDPDASLAVLDGLSDVIADADAADQPELVALALDVAANASGVGGAMMESVADIADILMDSEVLDTELYAVLDEAIAGLGNLDDAAASLAAIFAGTGLDPADVSGDATADQLAMAAIVLLAAEAASSYPSVEDYIDYLDDGPVLSATEQLAADLAAEAAAKYAAEGGTGPLADILSTFELIP